MNKWIKHIKVPKIGDSAIQFLSFLLKYEQLSIFLNDKL